MPDDPITPAAVEEEIEELGDEIDDVVELIAAGDIVAGERHHQLLEEVEQCRENLNTLSETLRDTSSQQAESPMLNRILEELSQIRASVTTLETKVESLRNSTHQTPSTNPPRLNDSSIPSNPQQPPNESPAVPSAPVQPPTPPNPKKQRRYL